MFSLIYTHFINDIRSLIIPGKTRNKYGPTSQVKLLNQYAFFFNKKSLAQLGLIPHSCLITFLILRLDHLSEYPPLSFASVQASLPPYPLPQP